MQPIYYASFGAGNLIKRLKTHNGERSKLQPVWVFLCSCKHEITLKKSQNNANSAIIPALMRVLWGDLWKLITEKRQTKAISANFQNMDSIQTIPVNIFVLRKSLQYEYEYYSVKKITQIRIWILFSLKKSTRIRIQTLVFGLNYSNSIQIPNYLLTSGPDNPETVQTIQKLSRQSGNCPDNPETVHPIQKLSGQSRNCPDNPKTVRTIQKLSW